MSEKSYQSYDEAAAAYLAEFDALLKPPRRPRGAPRSAQGPAALAPARTLVKRADAIAEISAAMIPLARAELQADDRAVSEGMSAHLAAQAGAELRLAFELLQMVEEETGGLGGGEAEPKRDEPREVGSDEAGPTDEGPGVAIAVAEDAGPSMRAAGMAGPTPTEPSMAGLAERGIAMQQMVQSLHKAMDVPPARALAPAAPARRGAAAAPAGIELAKAALREAAISSVTAISDRAQALGEAVAVDLITQTEWRAVVSGAAMINKEIAAKLESLKKGVGALIERAVAAATKTLLNVYDKLLALLGKDAENQARQKVQGWLEEIKRDGKVDLLGKLLARLYRITAFRATLDEWLAAAPADVDKVNGATSAVQAVPAKFATLAGYLQTVEDAVTLAKRFVKLPQVLAVAAGIQVLLLTVIVYSGYDYIGYRELKFPNLARGVAQVVQEHLGA